MFAWLWLVAGADLLWENNTADWLVAGADLVWENSTAGWLADKPNEQSAYRWTTLHLCIHVIVPTNMPSFLFSQACKESHNFFKKQLLLGNYVYTIKVSKPH